MWWVVARLKKLPQLLDGLSRIGEDLAVPQAFNHNVNLNPNHTMPSLEAITLRAQATRDAQAAIAATWVWEEKTPAQWDAALTSLDTKKITVSDLEADSLTKRSLYENTIAQLHDRTVDGLAMARIKWRNDEAKRRILGTLSAAGGGRETVQSQAQAWESVWEKFDAVWTPTAANTIAAYRTLITASATQEDDYKEAHTVWRTGAEELQVQANALWADCVAWYGAATVVFKEGTAFGDMIRGTIPTSPNSPEPTALEIASATPGAGGSVTVGYVPGGGAHATSGFLQWRIVGVDADFAHDVPTIPAGQTVVTGGTAGQVVEFRTFLANSAGTVLSAVQSATLV